MARPKGSTSKVKVPSTASAGELAMAILDAWKAGLASDDLKIRLEAAKAAAPYSLQKMPEAVELSGRGGGPIQVSDSTLTDIFARALPKPKQDS